jgi:hypothetical protein
MTAIMGAVFIPRLGRLLVVHVGFGPFRLMTNVNWDSNLAFSATLVTKYTKNGLPGGATNLHCVFDRE